jgi:hypothetical protein
VGTTIDDVSSLPTLLRMVHVGVFCIGKNRVVKIMRSSFKVVL